MAATFAATHFIDIPYTVATITHHYRAFVRNAQLVGGSWYHNSRTLDENDLLVSDSMDRIAALMSKIYDSATVWGTAQLFEKTGLTWVPVYAHAITETGEAASHVNTVQVTATFRDRLFYHVKVVFMEPNIYAPDKTLLPTGFSTEMDNCMPYFAATVSDPNDPYNWLVGRSNQFLATSPFISMVATINRKIRRARGLA